MKVACTVWNGEKTEIISNSYLSLSVAESFFKSLKQELVYNTYFYTKKQAKKEIFEYIEFFYNRTRSHSYLGNLSPNNFEEKTLCYKMKW